MGDPIAEIKISACLLVIMHIFLVKSLSALTMRSTLYTKYGYDIEVGPVSVTMALNFRANGSKLTKYTCEFIKTDFYIFRCLKYFLQVYLNISKLRFLTT